MLKLSAIFSQRDPRWSEILLGYNLQKPFTLGLYGCLITCFAMYVDKLPNVVNQILKENEAFTANSGNFYWNKSSVLGLRQIHISEKYNGPVADSAINQAKTFISQGYPLLAEIDFNPNTSGEEMHFVLIIGYEGDRFYAADPWVGKVIDLDVYGGFKRTVIQYRVYDKKLPSEIPLPINNEPTITLGKMIDESYLGMTNELPTQDEKNYRQTEGLPLNKLIESLSGDSRFFKKYIKPIQNQQIDDLTKTNELQAELIKNKDKKIAELIALNGLPPVIVNNPQNPIEDPVPPVIIPPVEKPQNKYLSAIIELLKKWGIK